MRAGVVVVHSQAHELLSRMVRDSLTLPAQEAHPTLLGKQPAILLGSYAVVVLELSPAPDNLAFGGLRVRTLLRSALLH